MNRRDLIESVALAQREGLTQAATGRVVELTISRMTEALLAGGKVDIRGFGTFKVHGRKARRGVNPQTGQAIEIPPSKAVKFKLSPKLREALNN